MISVALVLIILAGIVSIFLLLKRSSLGQDRVDRLNANDFEIIELKESD